MKNILLLVISFAVLHTAAAQMVTNGAWQSKHGSEQAVVIFESGYCTVTVFDIVNRKFIETWGGTFSQDGKSVTLKTAFHSSDKTKVGTTTIFKARIKDDILVTNVLPVHVRWEKEAANTDTDLSGLWVITAREQDGMMDTIIPGDRKTIKVLSGTRFQWAAINTATGEFFGTGGGTYSFENGMYAEHIEFFSRDSTRVGRTLTFRGYINNNLWDHSGKSSKGDPVHEVWTRMD